MVKKDEEGPEIAEEKSVHKDTKTTDAQEVREREHTEVAAVKKQTPWPLITVGIFGTVLLLAAVAMAWLQLVGMHRSSVRTSPDYGYSQQHSQQYGSGGRDYSRGGQRGSAARPVATGVVTAVSGDSITVSGGGKQVTVKTSSATRITGDETDVAVNDTVVVYGTKNDDGSIAATRIVVRNSAVLDDATFDDQDTVQIPSA